jgi:hypothetical protein
LIIIAKKLIKNKLPIKLLRRSQKFKVNKNKDLSYQKICKDLRNKKVNRYRKKIKDFRKQKKN